MEKRIQELVKQLNNWNYHYYTLDEPIVSDAEYDRLYDELAGLEKETGIVFDDSPTQRVGGEVLDKFEKHVHLSSLYSLDKAQNEMGILNWMERNQRLLNQYKAEQNIDLPELEYFIELKFDGLTINLTYNEGKLVMAATRGNGVVGEEILPQVKTIPSIPMRIDYKGLVEIQGEGVMPLSALARYNERNEIPLKNARNAAAGALRNLDSKQTKKRNLTAYFYNVGYREEEFISQEEIFRFLKDNHFKVYPYGRLVKTYEEMKKAISEIQELRKKIDILTDGVVIKINNITIRNILGYTNKFPRWAIAFKFEPDEYSTILKDVVWNVGRTGKVTPTAILEPVEIGDVTVQRATLNNYDDILRKNVAFNARVLVRRSNDVIPEILGTIEDNRPTTAIPMPEVCPSCGTKIIREGVHIFCPNSLSCKPQLVSRMVHFASRDAMDIAGLSEKTVLKIIEELDVRELSDIYDLTKEDLLQLEGFKEKKTQNLLRGIEASKKTTFGKFLYAIGIPHVGIKTSEDLSKAFSDLESLKDASEEELVKIPDIGIIVAGEIVKFFDDDRILEGIDHLLERGIAFEEKSKQEIKETIAEKRFVLTGTLKSYTRKELEEMILEAGGKTSSSVSKNTDYVIAGEKAGSKLAKAQELNIRVLTEDEFIELYSEE